MYLNILDLKKEIDDFKIDINLSVNEGEFLSLLGPSGCGKTTSLRLLSGFIKPDSGKIIMANEDITNSIPQSRNTGIVFQDYALFPNMNVKDNISYGPKVRGFSKEDIKACVSRFMKLLNLEAFEKRSVLSLSGGEQQRVALGRALAVKPKLLLLDEPLSALDAGLRKVLRKEIRKIQKELGITTIYITHDQEEAISMSDRIALMKDGKILELAKPKDLYENPGDLFTAEFIGASNILTGEIVLTEKNFYDVKTDIGIIKIKSKDKYNIAEKVKVFFRPENCKIVSKNNNEDNINIFEGNIEYREFLGKDYNLELRSKNTLINININTKYHENLSKNISIYFKINPDKIKIFRI